MLTTIGISSHHRCDWAVSMVTVAIEPGPDSSGIAKGTTAMSSFPAPSAISFSVARVSEVLLRSMSREVSKSRIPPAILNAAKVTPRSLKTTLPPNAKNRRTPAAIRQALRPDSAMISRANCTQWWMVLKPPRKLSHQASQLPDSRLSRAPTPEVMPATLSAPTAVT